MAHTLTMLRFRLSHKGGTRMLRRPRARMWHLVSTRNVILIGIVLSVVGLAALRVSLYLTEETWGSIKELLKELGATVFSLGIIALVWELFARRTFMREVLDSVELADQVADSGLQQICWNYNLDIPWEELFNRSTDVDLFFSYARTWRHSNYPHIERLVSRKGTKLRVILPNANNPAITAELARRFDTTPQEVCDSIRQAAGYYLSLPAQFPDKGEVECRFVDACPLMAIYLFSESGVLSLHSHQQKRIEVPALQVEAKRPMYCFMKSEFDGLYSKSHAAVLDDVKKNPDPVTPPGSP